ncbi:MAG: high-potential iron-sulfur protein [Deltaproteobacteria bacterium]|nr:high-potential iron-sulfur protein [Deltaproteobacteria bacterium]
MKKISRRELLRRSATFGAAGLGLVVLGAGCGGEEGPNCNDTSGLTPQQSSTRSSLGYVANSPHGAQKNCTNCNFFTAGSANECGACTLVPGPIAGEAYCNSWAAKA